MTLKSDVSAHATQVQLSEPMWPLPQVALDRFEGGDVEVPRYSLCALGFEEAELKRVYGKQRQPDWRDVSFQTGCAPFDSKFRAVWHALFESFAPIERGPAPVYWFLLRARAFALSGKPDSAREDVCAMGFETARPLGIWI